jgi:hypothetical protein
LHGVGRQQHRVVGLAISIAVFACGGGSSDPPPKVRQDAPVAERSAIFTGFRFAPTLEKHAPAGTKLAPLAEISLPHEARMKALIATHRADRKPSLQIEVWTFEQRGEDDVTPVGDPKPILQVEGRAADTPELEALRRDVAAPVSIVGRPQGLALQTATDALERLQDRAKIVRDEQQDAQTRLDALAEFVRGLDDDLWLSQKHVPWLLDLLATGPWMLVGQPDGSEHRTRMRAKPGEGMPEYSLAFLLKHGGWVLQEFEQRR